MKKLNITVDSSILHVILKEEPELFVKVSQWRPSKDNLLVCFEVLLKINGNEYLLELAVESADEARIAAIVKFESVICSKIAISVFKSIFKSLENDKEEEEICLNFLVSSIIDKIINK